MTELARKILDELMGADRNKLPSERNGTAGVHYSDPLVCRYHLVDFCPHLQFLNTKSDIGPCPKKYHEDALRDKFLREGQREVEAYEREFLDYLEKLVADLERRLRRGRDRLEVRPNDPSVGANPENDANEERRTLLDLQIKESLARIEKLGEEGRIGEAQELSLQVENMRLEVERIKALEAENPLYRLEKRMELCPTCGAFLIVGDAPKRIEAHYEGRQHNGWARVRQALLDYRKKYPDQRRSARSRSPPSRVDRYSSAAPSMPYPSSHSHHHGPRGGFDRRPSSPYDQRRDDSGRRDHGRDSSRRRY